MKLSLKIYSNDFLFDEFCQKIKPFQYDNLKNTSFWISSIFAKDPSNKTSLTQTFGEWLSSFHLRSYMLNLTKYWKTYLSFNLAVFTKIRKILTKLEGNILITKIVSPNLIFFVFSWIFCKIFTRGWIFSPFCLKTIKLSYKTTSSEYFLAAGWKPKFFF